MPSIRYDAPGTARATGTGLTYSMRASRELATAIFCLLLNIVQSYPRSLIPRKRF